MHRIYNEEHHETQVAENRQEVLRKAEVQGLERCISVIAKNSVKTGENYEIVNTRSQKFDKIFRYYVDLQVNGKVFTAVSDYNIITGASEFVSIAKKGEEVTEEVVLTEENIHGNKVYEEAYKYMFSKFGTELYDYNFPRMTAINYGRSTEIKCVFIGKKVLLISAMVSENHEPYVLVKEEKSNVKEVEAYLETLRTVENIKKEYNFKQVFSQVLSDTKYSANEVEILEITPVSQEEYIFIIYHRRLRYRFRIRGWYSAQENKVVIKFIEKVFSKELQDIKVPESPQVRVITKESITKNVEAKEAFDYLYKVQPTFRQTNVENIKI